MKKSQNRDSVKILSKCYLERFASINAPEKWTTNVSQRKKHVKRDFK